MVTGYELVRDKLKSVKICSVVKDVHRTRFIKTNLFSSKNLVLTISIPIWLKTNIVKNQYGPYHTHGL